MARRGHAKKIDTVHWTGATFEFGSLAAGASAANLLLAAQHLPETLLRIRGEWAAAMDGPVAGGVRNVVTVGIIQVPEGTGSTVLWDPVTDSDAPWIWWDCFNLIYEEMVTDALAAFPMGGNARVMDSKAMRKLRNTELQAVAVNIAGSGSTPIVSSGCMRVLAGS